MKKILPTNLTLKHHEVINLLKKFHQEYNINPSTRALINYAKEQAPTLHLDSILFHELFPGGISEACEIARLPKSPRCL